MAGSPSGGRRSWHDEEKMSLQASIEEKLTKAFAPQRLSVINESHLHAGHHHVETGHVETFDGAGETHFRVRLVSAAFAGMSRVERHRAVNDLLSPELKAGLHALAIEPAAPGEKTRW
jgi:BolA family transcriptional regulator, general stress-responsive regulator